MSKNSSEDKPFIIPDPGRKTYTDEQGRKYWFITGYYGRPIKMYGEPWKFRTTLVDLIAPTLIVGLAVYGILFGR